MNHDVLPDDLLWAAGGHASDVVLTALADGQHTVVPPAVRAHVEGCTTCSTHLGHAALLSLHAGRELAAMTEHARADAAARRPLPRAAIVLGLLVAALGLLPAFLEAPVEAAALRAFFAHQVPFFARGVSTLGRKLFEPGSPLALVVTYGTAALFVAVAFAVVRLFPKKERIR